MNLLVVVAPAIVLIGLHVVGFAAYCALCVAGRPPQIKGLEGKRFSLGRHAMVYWHWVLSPFERFLVKRRVSPNTITLIAMAVSIASGLSIALGHLATGGWLYVLSGTLDIVDGRLARATERSSAAGGFLDSVSDRWAEAAVFTGFAWFLRDSSWFIAVIIALAGSMMVSYVRAAGEVRGTLLDGGLMKRPERIVVVSTGTLVCAGLGAVPATVYLVPTVMGGVLAAVGLGSVLTAVGRWVQGYKNLHAMDLAAEAAAQNVGKPSVNVVNVAVGAKPAPGAVLPSPAHQPAAALGVVNAGTDALASASTRTLS